MAAALTLGGIGLGFGAAAVAGAVGLGIVAAAAAGAHRHHGHGGGGHGGGGGGYGGGGHGGGFGSGGGHGGYDGGHPDGFVGGYRRRRAVATGKGEEKGAGSASVAQVLELVRAQDVTGCGLRLVCELGGVDPRSLTVEELAIVDFIGPGVVPGEGVLPPGASGEYKAARGLGEAGRDCALTFPTCPLDGTQLMQVVAQYLP